MTLTGTVVQVESKDGFHFAQIKVNEAPVGMYRDFKIKNEANWQLDQQVVIEVSAA